MILIWQFHEAPLEYRRLSTNDGNEDWIILVPPQDEGILYKRYDGNQEIRLADGNLLVIGSYNINRR